MSTKTVTNRFRFPLQIHLIKNRIFEKATLRNFQQTSLIEKDVKSHLYLETILLGHNLFIFKYILLLDIILHDSVLRTFILPGSVFPDSI